MKARLSLALAALLSASMQAAEPTPQQAELFEKKVRPLLSEKCFKCHSHDGGKIKGALVLDSLSGVLQGGESGKPAIVPGKPDHGEMMSRIRSADEEEQMPPKGERLTKDQMAVLEEWIKQGAPWPGANGGSMAKRAKGKITDEDRQWWSFQPVKQVQPPKMPDTGWARTDIDRFIFQKLADNKLQPNREAPRGVLIRRLYFDLWGMPPSPKEVDVFVADKSPDAYEKLVDRLLASPRYGERWARHWLDLVRYADSDGYRVDDFRPQSWRYRDYVIRSLNADKPYDRFIKEQLAGDELFPDEPDALIATGYLRHWIYEYNNRDATGQWTTILNDITDTTGDVFFGLGMQCARCHDHKFDPILQKDYYRLQAFFSGIIPREDVPAANAKDRLDYANKLTEWENLTADIRDEIEKIEGPYKVKAADDAISKFPEDIQALIRKPKTERTVYEHQVAELAYRQIDYEFNRLATKMKAEDKEKAAALRKKLTAFDKAKPAPLPVAYTVSDVGPKAAPVTIPRKGDEVIDPGYLTLLFEGPAKIQPVPTAPQSSGRRAELARWLTDPENPLSARVMVNRVWQYHFGKGLVATSSDFGRLGEKPTHPELLDWMSRRFVADGWSFKKLHRLILTSAVYRQASSAEEDSGKPANSKQALAASESWKRGVLVDPENRFHWRANVRRLDAEQIRDALLSATGELKQEAVGPAVDGSKFNRSIYTKVLRNNRDPLLDVFDAPQNFSSTSSRDTTTTPVQSLLLINSQFMLLRSKAMALRLDKESAGDENRVIDQAYRWVYGRSPSEDERKATAGFLFNQRRQVNPELANSASAEFLTEKIPYRDGKAALMMPKSPQQMLAVDLKSPGPSGDFTVEAYVYLRSIPDDATLRTIAGRWSGDHSEPGWAFGVTGKQSQRKPQTLAMLLCGKEPKGRTAYEPVFSEVSIRLDKPYYVGASVSFSDPAGPSVTFFTKDLSNDDEPMLTTRVGHWIVGGVEGTGPLTIGGRAGKAHLWDGMIDDVRLSKAALPTEQLLLTSESLTERTVGFWQFEAKPSYFRDSTGHGNDIRPLIMANDEPSDSRTLALGDFCHVLLNSNEFLYVE